MPRNRFSTLLLLASVLLASVLVACGSPDLANDAGAHPDAGPDGSSPLVDGGPSAGDGGSPADAGTLVAVDPPPDPVFPETIGTLTIALRTADGDAAGTDSPIEICLTASDCFALNTPEVDDRQPGMVDELHLEGVDLPRAAVDRVTIRTTSDPATDNDRFTPACLHLRFDGEPVYCNEAIGVHVGTGSSAGEVPSWTDPEGLHQQCRSCWDDRTLTHGPMVGAPAPDGARVWVRTDATRPVGLRVGQRSDLDGAAVVDWALPSPADDYTSVLEVGGLEPGVPYYYRVEVAGDMSAPARPLRASLPPSAERVTMAFGSCTQYRPTPIFASVGRLQPDLFFFAGDNHYGNAQHVDAHRWEYRRMRRLTERAALMADTPILAIWDDHDFLANNSHGACARTEHAFQAFREYWANPAYGTDSTPGVFFRHREGPMELFALDCRLYRPDVGDTSSGCELASSPPALPMSGGPIGPAQTTWLMDAVADSDAPFKLLACGSRFTAEGSRDSWAAFDEARNALHADLHERRIEGVVFLSGDIHRSLLRSNPRSAGYDIPEITSSGMGLAPAADPSCPGESGVRFCTRTRSYVLLDVSATELTATVHDGVGDVLHTWRIERTALDY